MAVEPILRIPAFAKINLLLRVLGVRDDGYHELRTILQSIALHDSVTIRSRRGPFQLVCSDPTCPSDPTNLAWRAAERLWTAAGRHGAPRDVVIHLAKRIPMQAGLGGGSSDAAATLRGLSKLWRVDGRRVREVAASLGADVPYFLEGGTALGLDRGDELFPLMDIRPLWVTLVIPSFGVSTKDAYAWWDERSDRERSAAGRGGATRPAGEPGRRRPRQSGRLGKIPEVVGGGGLREMGNDLEAPVVLHHPEIARMVALLGQHGARHAAMSGSGSAVFGLFDRRPAAERAARALSRNRAALIGPGAGSKTVMVTRTMSRSSYRRLVGDSYRTGKLLHPAEVRLAVRW